MASRITVLLIEDETLVRLSAQSTLEDGGFECLTAEDGHAGLALIEEYATSAQALVTDIRMPGLNGWDLARQARERRPDLPVVYATADSANDWPSHGVPNSILLTKPFAEAQLLTAVSQLITQASLARSPGTQAVT